MSLTDVFRLLLRHWKLLTIVPLALAGSIFFFARKLEKTYSSATTIYTGIASGYNLKGSAESDYYSSNNAFDNLLGLITSRATKEEVAYRLLATHLRQNPSYYPKLQELIPATLRQKLVAPGFEQTVQNVAAYSRANTDNEIYRLLNSEKATYSLGALDHVSASRITTSDLIRIDYESNNPDDCRYTLELITQVFLERSKSLQSGQTTSVIGYYEAETKKAKERLDAAEKRFLAFNRDNNIINYDEQSKDVAAEKESLSASASSVESEYQAAAASLKAINKRLGQTGSALLSSNNVLEQRRQLSRLNAAIADQELFGRQQETTSPVKLNQLKEQAAQLAEGIRSSVNDYYTQSTSVEGIPSKDLLNEWVQNMILVEASRAKLSVMNKRKAEFEREYQRMAPLGATLKRIEREISLAEKDYLTLLASLNDSKATEQNTELTANLKVVDPPYQPLKPTKSAVLTLTLAGLLGGFVFLAGAVLASGLLDKSLKKPSVAAHRTGLPVAGVYPQNPPGQAGPSRLQVRSLEQLARHILLKANSHSGTPPFVVGVLSTLPQVGKTTLCQALAQQCQQIGIKVLALYPQAASAETPAPEGRTYSAEAAAVQGAKLADLAQGQHTGQQLVLIEFPALLDATYPVAVLPQLDLIFLTVRADRAWREADRHAIEELRPAVTAPVELVLSGLLPENTEEFLGAS